MRGRAWILVVALATTACGKREVEAVKETPPPKAAATQMVAASKKRFILNEEGVVAVTIAAPLETFKGETKKLSGVFDIDFTNLAASTGEVVADLDAFVTHTFGDPDKDEPQTEHAKNWFEIGEQVEKSKRDDYRMARFTLHAIESVTPATLDAAAADAGARTLHFKANGTLRVHGREVRRTVEVDVTFHGPPAAPTALSFRTTAPLVASLSEHDVKPRDLTGKFLAGALEKVGKKIDDRAQVHIEGRAAPKG